MSQPIRTLLFGVGADQATVAVIVNAVPRGVGHEPGLIAMLDLPVVPGRGTVA